MFHSKVYSFVQSVAIKAPTTETWDLATIRGATSYRCPDCNTDITTRILRTAESTLQQRRTVWQAWQDLWWQAVLPS